MDWKNPYIWFAAGIMFGAFIDKLLEHIAKTLKTLAIRLSDLADAWHEVLDAFGKFRRKNQAPQQ